MVFRKPSDMTASLIQKGKIHVANRELADHAVAEADRYGYDVKVYPHEHTIGFWCEATKRIPKLEIIE